MVGAVLLPVLGQGAAGGPPPGVGVKKGRGYGKPPTLCASSGIVLPGGERTLRSRPAASIGSCSTMSNRVLGASELREGVLRSAGDICPGRWEGLGCVCPGQPHTMQPCCPELTDTVSGSAPSAPGGCQALHLWLVPPRDKMSAFVLILNYLNLGGSPGGWTGPQSFLPLRKLA